MSNEPPEKEYFFCRKGMKHIGPLSRNMLRRYLAAGLIDAQTLISLNDEGRMLPLGASAAAGEITWTIRAWQKKFSLPVFLLWLCFMPLFSAGFAAFGVYSTFDSLPMMVLALLFAKLGMTYWLWRTWNLLLVDKSPLTAMLYALPMALPLVNCFWVWKGYIQLPKYWARYKDKLDIDDETIIHSWIYYLAVIFFYLMIAGTVLLIFVEHKDHILLIQTVAIISWMWFGLTLYSLCEADHFATRVIQKKLSNLAFGALKFCADIDYDVLHKTVLSVALSARKKSRLLALATLIVSWLAGGWFWVHALENSLTEHKKSYWLLAKDCIVCNKKAHFIKYFIPQSNFDNTNAERQGK